MIETIRYNDLLYAIILPADFQTDGLHFISDEQDPQQVGYMKHPHGYVIKPHVHNPVIRTIEYTYEVLFIKRGKVRVDFYHNDHAYVESRILSTGDTILLGRGGHGFEMLEETEIIEVKQGPYPGAQDKVKFDPINQESVRISDGSTR